MCVCVYACVRACVCIVCACVRVHVCVCGLDIICTDF